MKQELHSGIQAREITLSLYEYEDDNVHEIFEERRSLIQKYFSNIPQHSRSVFKTLSKIYDGAILKE